MYGDLPQKVPCLAVLAALILNPSTSLRGSLFANCEECGNWFSCGTRLNEKPGSVRPKTQRSPAPAAGLLGMTARQLFLCRFGFGFFGRRNDWLVLALSAGLSGRHVARALDV